MQVEVGANGVFRIASLLAHHSKFHEAVSKLDFGRTKLLLSLCTQTYQLGGRRILPVLKPGQTSVHWPGMGTG